jgi:hypothetical protein
MCLHIIDIIVIFIVQKVLYSLICMLILTLSRGELESLYCKESDASLRERLLLILKVECEGMIPAHVARDLHGSRSWTSD